MPILGIDVEARFAQVMDALSKIGGKTESTARQMSSAFNGVKGALGALGVGLSVAGFVKFSQSTLESVAALDDLSEKSALSVETLSKLQEVTRIGGTSLSDAAEVASKFAVKVALAAGGNEALIARFKQLKISIDDLKSKSFDELFVKFATNIADAPDKTNALAVAVKLSSRAAADALPFFNDLAEKGLGLAKVTTEQAAAAEKVQKQFRELTREAAELQQELLIKLLPALQKIGIAMANAAREGGGLGGILKAAFKAAVQTDDVNVFSRQIVGLDEKLTGLRARLTRAEGAPKNAVAEFLGLGSASTINSINKQIADTEEKLRDLRNLVKVTENPIDAPSAPAKPKPPAAPVGVIQDEGKSDKAAAARKAAAEATIRLNEQRAKIELEIAKSGADAQLAVLNKRHSDELVSDKEFFAQRAAIQKTAFDAEIAASSKLIAIKLKEFEKPQKDSTQADRINNIRDLEAALRDHDKLKEASTQLEVLQALESQAAEKAYKEEVQQVTLALDELRGKTVEVAGARFDLANKSTLKKADERGDTATRQIVADLRTQTVAQVQFGEAQRKSGEITTRLGLEEERIARSREAGAISEFESLRLIDEARNRSLATLKKQVDALRAVADASNNDALKLAAEEAQDSLEKLAASADLVGDKVRGIFKDAFTTELDKLIQGTTSVKQAFLGMAKSIADSITKIGLDELGTKLFGKDGALTGKDGPFGDLGELGAKLLGIKRPAKEATPAAATSGIAAVAGSFESNAGQAAATAAAVAQQTAAATAATAASTALTASLNTAAGSGLSINSTFLALAPALTDANVQIFALATAATSAATALASVATSSAASSVGDAFSFIGPSTGSPFGAFSEIFGLARGGIMTAQGLLPLQKFASGGIASGPMAAIFGEGRMNEAYVPLPDGRRIPVVQKGGKGDVTVVNNFTLNGPTDSRSQSQLAAMTYQGVQRGLRNL